MHHKQALTASTVTRIPDRCFQGYTAPQQAGSGTCYSGKTIGDVDHFVVDNLVDTWVQVKPAVSIEFKRLCFGESTFTVIKGNGAWAIEPVDMLECHLDTIGLDLDSAVNHVLDQRRMGIAR